jgi:membrane-bound lytic murein transglycosylase F
LFKEASKRLGWDWRLIAALVFVESEFDPDAQSHLGAYGLMQVIPETAEQFNVSDYFQIDSNILRILVPFLKPMQPL